jgi:DEAD/DEAH box helicase domain-containing protein
MGISKYKNILVFDIETIGDLKSSNFVESMEITVVGVYSYATGEYKGYWLKDIEQMEKLFKNADLIVGYNNDHFDTPILNKYFKFDLSLIPSLDIMVEIQKQIGHRVGLNSVAGATLGEYKSGSGDNAMVLYREGKLKELEDYCLQDVKLTKEIFDWALSNSSLNYTSKDGWLRIRVDFDWNLDKIIDSQKIAIQSALI